MKHAFLLFAAVWLAFTAVDAALGHQAAQALGFGAITLMSGLISLTFLWLWSERATPLALGMSFSWAGTASLMGWWWVFGVLGRPAWMAAHPALFLFLSLHVVGTVLHLAVMRRSMDLGRAAVVVPIAVAAVLLTLLAALV